MSDIVSPDIVKDIIIKENDAVTTPTKKVLLYGWDTDNLKKTRIKTNSEGKIFTAEGFEIPPHDYIELNYTGDNLTSVVYKKGGSNGQTVATLTLTYDVNNNLISISKS